MDKSHDRIVYLEKKVLKRDLRTGDLFAIGYGDVGSSIYYALGATALFSMGATPISMLLAGLLFICTGLTYAELASTFPEPGGSVTFSRYAFNDLISFIAGCGLLLDYIVTIAISAFAIPPYIKHFLNLAHIHESVPTHLAITVGIIGFLFIVNLIGIKASGRLSLFLAIITILSQLFLILVAGIFLLNIPYVISHMKIGVSGVDWSPSWPDFIKGTAMAMVAYTGIEAITQLAAEVKKPAVSIPKAIKWTMTVLIVLYFGISVTGLSVISPHELGTTYLQDPLAGIVKQFPFGGTWLASWFGLIAGIILLIAANAGLIGCSRLAFSMGKYYQLPSSFYRLNRKFQTPYVSLAVFAIAAALIVLLSRGRMLFLADLYNFGVQIAFFSAHMSLLVLRWKKPELERPYRAPFNIPVGKNRSLPVTAIIGAIGSFAVWILVIVTKPEGRNLGFLWLAIGLGIYFYYRKIHQMKTLGQLSIEKIHIPEYKPMHLRHILVTARYSGNTEALQTACQLAKSFNATLTAVHLIDIPLSLPINVSMEKREKLGEEALKRAEAVAHEYGLLIYLKLIRTRSIEGALLNLIRHGEYDLVVVSAGKEEFKDHNNFVMAEEKFLKTAPCRVIFCKS